MCHPGSLPWAESRRGGEGCVGCAPSQRCREGMLRARGTGRRRGSTHNRRHVVLCPPSATGHWEREGGISSGGDPFSPAVPHPLPLLLRQGHPNHPQLHHILPASLPACQRLSSFEKHQGCLQKQLKNVGVDRLTPSSFFSGSVCPLEAGGISWAPPIP